MSIQKENVQSGEILDLKVIRQLYQFVKPYVAWFYLLVFLTIALAPSSKRARAFSSMLMSPVIQ